MNQYIHIFIVGVVILVGAIIINLIASALGLSTWFKFVADVQADGFAAFAKQGILSLLYLFVIYPAVLGALGYFGTTLISKYFT